MNFTRIFSSGADSPDHRNFKIKPFTSIFDSQQSREVQDEKSKEGYPPPCFPKFNSKED